MRTLPTGDEKPREPAAEGAASPASWGWCREWEHLFWGQCPPQQCCYSSLRAEGGPWLSPRGGQALRATWRKLETCSVSSTLHISSKLAPNDGQWGWGLVPTDHSVSSQRFVAVPRHGSLTTSPLSVYPGSLVPPHGRRLPETK